MKTNANGCYSRPRLKKRLPTHLLVDTLHIIECWGIFWGEAGGVLVGVGDEKALFKHSTSHSLVRSAIDSGMPGCQLIR